MKQDGLQDRLQDGRVEEGQIVEATVAEVVGVAEVTEVVDEAAVGMAGMCILRMDMMGIIDEYDRKLLIRMAMELPIRWAI